MESSPLIPSLSPTWAQVMRLRLWDGDPWEQRFRHPGMQGFRLVGVVCMSGTRSLGWGIPGAGISRTRGPGCRDLA